MDVRKCPQWWRSAVLVLVTATISTSGAMAQSSDQWRRQVQNVDYVTYADSGDYGCAQACDDNPSILEMVCRFFGFGKRRRYVCPPAMPVTPEPEKPSPTETPTPPTQEPETPPPSPDMPSSLETASATQTLAPNMFGDILGFIYQGPPRVGGVGAGLTPGEVAEARIIRRFKIGDNTSPVPTTRLNYSYNFFQDAFDSTGDIHRNFAGVELAMFDGNFSIDFRGSLNTFDEFTDIANGTNFGDLRTAFKGIITRRDDWLASGGFAIGYPTAPRASETPFVWLVAPFLGYMVTPQDSNFYMIGFQQLDIPLDADDQLLLHTDISAGYWLMRNNNGRLITGFAPQVELHLYTPIGDDPSGDLRNLVYKDVLNLAMGTTVVVRERAWISTALGVPISTQKDYDLEIQFHINWLF